MTQPSRQNSPFTHVFVEMSLVAPHTPQLPLAATSKRVRNFLAKHLLGVHDVMNFIPGNALGLLGFLRQSYSSSESRVSSSSVPLQDDSSSLPELALAELELLHFFSRSDPPLRNK